jgi:hypothetical protein
VAVIQAGFHLTFPGYFDAQNLSTALLSALALITIDGQVLAASPNVPQTPEKTVPQGSDPPGGDNDAQSSPSTKHEGVITPPKTGD